MGSLAGQKILYLLGAPRRLLALLLTAPCPGCGKSVCHGLCDSCRALLSPAESVIVPPDAPYSKLAFAYYYDGPAKKLLLACKFGRYSAQFSDILADWLLLAYKSGFSDEPFDCAVCVPYFRERNVPESSTYFLRPAADFCARAGILFSPGLIEKTRHTERQHTLSAKERSTNLSGAFRAKDVAGKRILLIDDIFTTGSTARECAKALLGAGAAEVCVLAVLKTRFG